jgi:hypothetical protein
LSAEFPPVNLTVRKIFGLGVRGLPFRLVVGYEVRANPPRDLVVPFLSLLLANLRRKSREKYTSPIPSANPLNSLSPLVPWPVDIWPTHRWHQCK